MSIECSKLFRRSELLLLVWHRLDPDMHKAGLDLMKGLLDDPTISKSVMPLLRPTGRRECDYRGFDGRFAEHVGRLPGRPQEWRMRCCEMWVQVEHSKEDEVWKRLSAFVTTHASSGADAKAWRRHRFPRWQPFSDSFSDCGYCESSPGRPANSHCRYADALVVLSQLGSEEDVASLLKVIWYRASIVIADRWIGPCAARALDPCDRTDQAILADWLDLSLAPFDPASYGIVGGSTAVDPTAFAVSHMAAFAMNAVVAVTARGCHIEQIYGDDCLTHPYHFGSRLEYIRAVRAATC